MTGPQRFRKKPIPVEAMQWDGTFDGYLALASWCGASVEWHPARTHDTSERPDGTTVTFERPEPVPQHVRLFVAANDAWLRLEPEEWVLSDARGFYPCKPDIFEATYNPDQSPLSHEMRTIADAVLSSPHPVDAGHIRRIPYVGDYTEAIQVTVEAKFTADEIERLRGAL